MNLVDPNIFFQEVTLRISSSLEIESALRNLGNYLRKFMPLDSIGLHYADTERMTLFSVADVDYIGRGAKHVNAHMDIRTDTECLAMIDRFTRLSKKAHIEPDGSFLPKIIQDYYPDSIDNSVLLLPLSIEEELLGVMVVSAVGRNRYQPEHANLIIRVQRPISIAMSNARRYREMVNLKNLLADDNRELSRELEQVTGTQVVGAEFGLRQVMELVRQVAPMNSPVLLLGETGTGKEVIANAIHMASNRREAPMVRVQCGAIPETLLDSELFGHEKGAFTGASERKRGRFERADGGVIFLDEIGELTPEAQVKLLRVLQEKEIERLGGTHPIPVDVRVIAATHRDLAQMVRDGRFREDLWFRLNVFPIFLPPLRMRRGDIPSLVQHFINRKARELNLETVPATPPATLERLKSYDWPGNVRELQNVIERALILSRTGTLQIPELSAPQTTGPAQPIQTALDNIMSLDQAMADYIRRVLDSVNGKIAGSGGAAELLDIHPSTLRSRMKKMNIRIQSTVQ